MFDAFVWDWESHEITPDNPTPKTVCMSYAWLDTRNLTMSDVELVTADVGHYQLSQALRNPTIKLIGANSAFDIEEDVAWSPYGFEEQQLWVWALDNDRVFDVLHRQGYWELATDRLPKKYYSLDSITLGNLNVKLDKDDELRRGFGKLDGVPVHLYPPRAANYAKADTWATGHNFIHQERLRRRGSPYFPGLDVFADQHHRMRKALSLKGHEATGMRSNARTVAMFERHVRREIDDLRARLVPRGFVTRKITRPKGRPAQYCQAMGLPVPKNFGIKTLENHPDPVLRGYRQAEPPQCVFDAGLAVMSYHDSDAATSAELASEMPPDVGAFYDWKARKFRYKHLPDRDAKAFEERLDDLRINLTPTGALKVDKDACERASSEDLKLFGRYSGLCNTLNNPIKLARKHSNVTLHPFYRPLVATGRTSTTPNVQNMKREPGVREMWEAPPGWVIVDGDFTTVELHAFSEICYRVLGWTDTGDALNNKVDVHSRMAAAIMGITYDQALALKAADDFVFGRNRTAAKGVNFGAIGGMKAKAFVKYCWNNYRVEITLERAKELLALHSRVCREFPLYSQRYAQSFARDRGQRNSRYDIIQPWSARLRANCAFTDAHNSPFQGLAADLAGVTLWALYKETRGCGPLGFNSPLYGCRLFLFVHDSFAVLAPEGRHTAAALRLQEVAEECGKIVMQRCPPRVEVTIARQLSKKAKLIKLPDGSFGVWDLWEQIAKAANKVPGDVHAKREHLKKDEWPQYAIDATLPIAA